MERKITSEIMRWKTGGNKTVLLIKGARQVGKTYIVERFGESNYDHYLRIDLRNEKMPEGFWSGNAQEILRRITQKYPGFRIERGRTLLFLDEIQDSQEAMSALKTLAEKRPIDVICSGSHLGLYEKSPKRYPVGSVHEITMHPMDFEEYLWAIGLTHEQTEDIRNHAVERRPFDPATLHIIESYYRQYLIVGGMPLPVLESVRSVNAAEYIEAQDDILLGYQKDILAYAGKDRDEVLKILNLVPTELGRPNKRLRFKDIDGTANSGIREYRDPIDWIEGSRYVSVCRRLATIDRPLRQNARDNMLKLYLVDTGLLVRLYGQGTVDAMMRGDISVNEGAIGENSVCQMLTACGLKPFYYEIDKEIEIDFVVEIGTDLCAVEVKTGKKRRARSLKKLMETEVGKKVNRWIKFEYGNILMTDDGVEHYPLFMAAFSDLLTERQATRLVKADPSISFK